MLVGQIVTCSSCDIAGNEVLELASRYPARWLSSAQEPKSAIELFLKSFSKL